MTSETPPTLLRLLRHDARKQKAELAEITIAGRQRVDDIALEHALLHDGLHVDHRSLARNRQGFLDRADAQSALTVAVNEPVRAMPSRLIVGEAGQREGHCVSARPKIDDLEDAFAVGRDRAHFLDERRDSTLQP